MDLELLKRFYITAREKSITKAARRICVAQSALTRSIQLFESQMNTTLFTRVPKGVQLTVDGERLYEFARILLLSIENFQRNFFEKIDEIEGEIRILTLPFMASEWLVPLTKEFLELYPKVKFKIITKTENLEYETIDVSIRPSFERCPYLTQDFLFNTPVSFYASQDYINKNGIPENLGDLAHHKLIAYKSRLCLPYECVNSTPVDEKPQSDETGDYYYEIDSLQGTMRAALEGLGIAALPSCYTTVKSSALVRLDLQVPEKGPAIYFIHSKDRRSKKIRALLHFLKSKSGLYSQ